MRRLILGTSIVVAWLALALSPTPAAAHALGQVFTLPVPLSLYLAAAGAAVAASFVVAVVVVRPPGLRPRYPIRPVAPRTARGSSLVLQAVGLVWWLGTIAAGFLVDPISALPAVLFWIGIWVGLPIIAVLFGNPWPSLSPFRALFGLVERLVRLAGFDRLDLGATYPAALGRWPAAVLLGAAVWCELILPDRTTPSTIGWILSGYTVITLAGMFVFGKVAWLRNVEVFEVLLGWFGRVGPVGRRVTDPTVCQDCGEACDPEHCVDCPECAAAAEPGQRRAELRPWFSGLTEVGHASWSDAALITLALAAVSFDGFSETGAWGAVMSPSLEFLFPIVGAATAVLLVQTVGLSGLWLVFLGAFSLSAWLTQRLHDPDRQVAPLGATAGAYAATLLPIAGGYLVAHYLTLLIQGIAWLPSLLIDPLASVAPPLDWIPISMVWYLSVGAIVVGHIAAVVLAHRQALRDAPSRPALAGLPLVILMVAYTVFSLWIIAQPITAEPMGGPASLLLQ